MRALRNLILFLVFPLLLMGSKANGYENSYMLLVFNNTNIANIGDATGLRGSSTAGSLYITLHTGDPGEGGSCTTSEAAYGSYARQGVARSGAGWTVTNNAAVNAALIQFPQATSGSETETYFGICAANSGASVLLYSGALSASLAVSTGVRPQFAAGDLSVSED